MTEGFFAGQTGGSSAASWKPRGVGDGTSGIITETSFVDKKKYGTNETETDPATGAPIKQLRIVIQAQPDNYATAAKPLVDDQQQMIPDDGKRALYVARNTNISFAIANALAEHKLTDVQIGGQLAIQLVGMVETGKASPAKDHKAWYTPPAQTSGFGFEQQPAPVAQPQYQQPVAQPQAPQPVAQQAPPVQYQQPAQPVAQPQGFQPGALQQPAQPVAQPQAPAPIAQTPPAFAPPPF